MAIKRVQEHGPSGKAKITRTEKFWRLRFEDGEVFDVLPEDAPDHTREGTFNLLMNVDANRLLFLSPVGPKTLFAKLDSIAPAKGSESDDPAPFMVQGGVRTKKDGSTWVQNDMLMFQARFEILSQDHNDGLVVVNRIPYAFRRYGTDETAIGGNGTRKLEAFLEACGMDFSSDTIPWSDNVLPWLSKFLLNKDAVVVLEISEAGWVRSVSPAPEGTVVKRRD